MLITVNRKLVEYFDEHREYKSLADEVCYKIFVFSFGVYWFLCGFWIMCFFSALFGDEGSNSFIANLFNQENVKFVRWITESGGPIHG